MARSAKPFRSQDLIGQISDTIANHPRLSAAAAFQMGVLLGQVMQNSSAIRGLTRKITSAPGTIASSIPTFGLFDGGHSEEPRAAASRRNGTGRTRSRAKSRGTKRRKRARTA
jgi:hypothetical protein